MLRMPEPVFIALGTAGILLAGVTVGTSLSSRMRRPFREAEIQLRIRMWWYIVSGFFIALAIDRRIAVTALALVSFVAFKEFLTLAPTRRADSTVLLWAYLAIPIQYFLAGSAWHGLFLVFIPVYAFLLLPMRMVLVGEAKGFLHAVGVIHWGLMTTVFCISHLAYMLALPDLAGLPRAGVSLLFYLVVLTQLNDTVQYLVDRRFGRHPVLSRVRAGLSVEGIAAAVGATALAALAISPLFTPFSMAQALLAGIMIGVFGLAGFITTAAVERDIGVSESGHFLPGHGGLLERLDSLVFTAPVFFHFVHYQFY